MAKSAALRLVPPRPVLGFADPQRRGWGVVYRRNEVNHCPGCGRSHWWVGRLTSECAFCCTAIPNEGTKL